MGLKLKKGTSLPLKKKAPALKVLRIECGWEVLARALDLDVSVFGLKEGRALESHVVYWGQNQSHDGAVTHSGDNKVGGGGVVESIEVDLVELAKKSPFIEELSVIMSIDNALKKGFNFGKLSNAFVRLVNSQTNEVVVEYDLDEQFNTSISVQIGSLIKDDAGDWSFSEVAHGYPDKDFEQIANKYGIYSD